MFVSLIFQHLGCIMSQCSQCSPIKFSALQLSLPDVGVLSMRELHQSFDVHHEGVDMEMKVELFQGGVVGQNTQIIHSGNYVKLLSNNHEVNRNNVGG